MAPWTDLLTFAVVAAALTVTPGVDTALVLRAALTGGGREAVATAGGIVAGLLAWGVGAAVGVSALVTASTLASDVLRYAGAGYLAWLGVRLLHRAVRGGGATGTAAGAAPLPAWRAARTGLLTNLLNPKVGVFYVALLPQFLPAGGEALVVGLLLAAVHGLLSALWFALLIGLAAVLGPRLRHPRVVRVLDGTTGTVLVGVGVRLALGGR